MEIEKLQAPTILLHGLLKALLANLIFKNLDPCCGTGNFLLQLPEHVTFHSVYGNDIDTVSVKITRLNMALKYNVPITAIYKHITESDYLINYSSKDFQYIIGNPPWGYEFSEDEKSKLRVLYKSASGKNIESYDVFIEQALNHLAVNGHLTYVLPEAILNIKAHTEIRKIIIENCCIKNLDFLGNAFDGVQCPSIILDLQCTHSALSTLGMNVNTSTESFTINTERTVNSEYFSFTTSDAEYNVMNKIRNISNASYLLGNADFALGIVTGNNKKTRTTTVKYNVVDRGVKLTVNTNITINQGEIFEPLKYVSELKTFKGVAIDIAKNVSITGTVNSNVPGTYKVVYAAANRGIAYTRREVEVTVTVVAKTPETTTVPETTKAPETTTTPETTKPAETTKQEETTAPQTTKNSANQDKDWSERY